MSLLRFLCEHRYSAQPNPRLSNKFSGPVRARITEVLLNAVNGMETFQNITPNLSTPGVLKLQCDNFAKRVLN